MAQPRIGVITAVQPVHLARIGSLEAIEAAKGELLEALPPDGRAILNADDPIVRRMGHRSAARSLTYGFAADADVGADAVASAGLDGMRFILRAEGARRPVSIPTLGRLSVHNALAGAAVGLVAGLSLDEIATGLETGWSAAHRVQLVRIGGVTLVDDTYNASPRSVVAALDLLAGLPGRRGAVLGEMLELGEAADEGHRAVGEAAARTVDWLVVVGDGAAGIAEGAQAAGLAPARIVRVAMSSRPSRRSRRGCATATWCSSRRRAGSGSTGSSKASEKRPSGGPSGEHGRADPGPAARPRADGHPHVALHPAAAHARLRQADPDRRSGEPFHQARHADDGRRAHRAGRHRDLLLPALGPDASTFAPLAALAGVGLLGAFDDYLNAKTGEGIRVRQKLIWLTVVAFVAAWQIQQTYNITAIPVPFVGKVTIDPWVYVAFGTFAIVAAANGVNITDGLDGLSGGTVAIAFVAYMLIALLNAPLAQPNLALLCVLIIGALLGFLWFNVHPAQIFIGDSGALSLGATLAVTALITGQILVLPLIGIIFVIETMSVILQVAYFRLSGGQRLFRMSPIHHHFELGGWDEEKITIRFWIVAILAALLGVTLFLASVDRLR
jgi:phospho-N-acetylmuramoyl-pentapeptide-transferase